MFSIFSISAPKAFQLKKVNQKGTVAKSPFSTDRKYDIPQGDGFHIHKSDKELTQFEDFDRLNRDWKVRYCTVALVMVHIKKYNLI